MDIKECAKYKIVEQIPHSPSPVAHYVAVQTMLDRQVEMRILKQTVDENSGSAKRFIREFKILAKLDHPAIVPILDFGWSNRRLFYTTAHRPAKTLVQVITERQTQMSSEEIINVALPIAEVLAYMHDNELIHRGLRLGGVKKNEDSATYYISEFDMIRPTTSTMTACGVPLTELVFRSPEMRNPDREVDHRADQFMLGCLLFSLASNKNLEEADKKIFVSQDSREELAHKLQMRGLHSELAQMLVALTKLEAEDRYKDMKAVIASFKRISHKLEALETSRAVSQSARSTVHKTATEEINVEPSLGEKIKELATRENWEKLKKRAKPFAPLLFIFLVLVFVHGLVTLASLEFFSTSHVSSSSRKHIELVGRVMAIDSKVNQATVAKGKRRFLCLLPKGFAIGKLRPKDMLFVKGNVEERESDEKKTAKIVVQCKQCIAMHR